MGWVIAALIIPFVTLGIRLMVKGSKNKEEGEENNGNK